MCHEHAWLISLPPHFLGPHQTWICYQSRRKLVSNLANTQFSLSQSSEDKKSSGAAPAIVIDFLCVIHDCDVLSQQVSHV